MSQQTGVTALDKTIHKTNAWLNEIREALGLESKEEAYHALKAVLQALRDNLPAAEIAQLGAQLPVLVRGIYYEGYNPINKTGKKYKIDSFLMDVHCQLGTLTKSHPEQATRAVIRVLRKHVSEGEIEEVKGVLPATIRDMWPL